MPVGQQPVASTANYVSSTNTSSLKVYYKLTPTADWEDENSLVCLGHSKTKGAKIGSAQFMVLTKDNATTDTDWINADLAMRFNAAVKYKVDMSSGYSTPYLVKVTDIKDGEEECVWQGYLSTVSQDFKAERAVITGLTIAGLLDQQQIYGGWYITTAFLDPLYRTVDYFFDHVPVYNPKGIGNRSVYYRLSEGSYRAQGIDNRLTKTPLDLTSLWTVKDLLYQVFARCTDPLFNDTTEADATQNTYNVWMWAGDVLRASNPFDISTVETILDSSSTLNDYSLQGKTIWEAIVELVESVDGLTVSEEIDTTVDIADQRPYIKIINLRAGA